ncbi:MAG: lytic transglycosylase domain-containing protein [Candidatus Eremiobacteraeota bacterium]|nr:lytic transglycosylase domain-containing protein [Candidatus Eremiobacteraeota bacterium]
MSRVAAAIAAVLFIACAIASPPPARAQEAPGVSVYARVLSKINPHLQRWQSRDLASHVLANSERWRIDANMLVALVTVESRWHPAARSYAGAIGLGQLMPSTARRLNVNPRNADQNLSGCARYLSGLIDRYEYKPNRYILAFAAYNAGPKAVAQFHGVPPYSETQRYVVKVMRWWNHFKAVVHLPERTLTAIKNGGAIVTPPSSDLYGPAPLSDSASFEADGSPPAP